MQERGHGNALGRLEGRLELPSPANGLPSLVEPGTDKDAKQEPEVSRGGALAMKLDTGNAVLPADGWPSWLQRREERARPSVESRPSQMIRLHGLGFRHAQARRQATTAQGCMVTVLASIWSSKVAGCCHDGTDSVADVSARCESRNSAAGRVACSARARESRALEQLGSERGGTLAWIRSGRVALAPPSQAGAG